MSKEKAVALIALMLGSLTLTWTVVAFRRPAIERYYAWRLESASEEERKAAAKQLLELASPLVVLFLIRDFAKETGEPGWEARRHLAELPSFQDLCRASKIPSKAAAAACAAEALSDEHPGTRRVSAWFLERLGTASKVAVAQLARGLGDTDSGVRGECARALRRLGPDARAALSELQASLSDREFRVRMYAAETLGLIGPEAGIALPALIAIVEKETDLLLVETAREAIIQIRGR